jgi:predicted permease
MILAAFMLVGFVCGKKGIITDSGTAALSGLLLNATLPALMIMSLQKDFDASLLKNGAVIVAAFLATQAVGAALGLILCRLFKVEGSEKNVWVFELIFANIAYMGIPVVKSLYGSGDAMFYVAMCGFAFNFLVFSLGVKLMAGAETKIDFKAIAVSPPIITTAIGFALFVFSVKLPATLSSALESLGDMTTPLSMIITGSILSRSDFKSVFTDRKMYVPHFVRLIALPLITFYGLRPFIKDETALGTLVTLTGMPTASLVVVLATRYNGDAKTASRFVFVTTIASMFTIPAITILF